MEIAARQTRSLSRRVSSHEMAGPLVISSPQLSFSSPPLSSAMISAQLHSPLVTLQKAQAERARGTRIPPTSEAFKKVLYCLAPVSASPSYHGAMPCNSLFMAGNSFVPFLPQAQTSPVPLQTAPRFPMPSIPQHLGSPMPAAPFSSSASPLYPKTPLTSLLHHPPGAACSCFHPRFGCRTPLINSCSNRSAENLASSHCP